RLRDDVDAAALAVEPHHAVGQREQRVVAAAADVAAGVVAGAALPHQDAAGRHRLAAVLLDAQPLAVRLAAVADRTLPFFRCHVVLRVSVAWTGPQARSAGAGHSRAGASGSFPSIILPERQPPTPSCLAGGGGGASCFAGGSAGWPGTRSRDAR